MKRRVQLWGRLATLNNTPWRFIRLLPTPSGCFNCFFRARFTQRMESFPVLQSRSLSIRCGRSGRAQKTGVTLLNLSESYCEVTYTALHSENQQNRAWSPNPSYSLPHFCHITHWVFSKYCADLPIPWPLSKQPSLGLLVESSPHHTHLWRKKALHGTNVHASYSARIYRVLALWLGLC